METNGDVADVSRILSELETLKSAKSDIEHRISVLEAQLREKHDAVTNGSCPSISTVDSNGLSPDMIYRYSRHLLLPSFGVQGQSNLLKSSILVIGAGGLGSPALLYLAACGVGKKKILLGSYRVC
ncbi:hypothetical protein Patl1_04107 [Pistacia atlantica]|uniref:Uncharacterized protein n=1 Tax=Pistacia atlantica TaxID=434234 RepID=A0ACC1BV67_9ROSI|nr:hypothetical protein Patl1_04107 [Pistacia atlantica]